jgi:hypothetical protein
MDIMPEKKPRGRRFKLPTNAVNITVHTMDGTKMPVYVRDEVLEEIDRIAGENQLVVSVVES